MWPTTGIHSEPHSEASVPRVRPLHPLCIGKCGRSATQLASWQTGLQTQASWLQGSNSFCHTGLNESRGQGKNGGGGHKQKARRAKKAVGTVRKGANTSSRSCSPKSTPRAARRRQEGRRETPASSLPKARARRGILKFSWLPWRDSPLTNGEQMRPFSQ